jgi:hypothetical protein
MLQGSDVIVEAIRNLSASDEPVPEREEIDYSLLEDSLRLSPWQRLMENERALELVRMLEAAQPRANGAPEPNS